tara:strand:- start:2307 stop:2750 length:444 start_codon:yes stop_codon:yes gene_type:complete
VLANGEEETKKFAQSIVKLIKKNPVLICLNGPLGSGKTTFSRYFIRSYFSNTLKTEIPSPTFTLMQIYEHLGKSVYHYDFYRLNSPDELVELNFEENLLDGVSLVEWAEKFEHVLPRDRIEIMFNIKIKNKRKIEIKFLGATKNLNK